MFIAQQKKKENIAEYILYMWQLEDMLRACDFNAEVISSQLVAPLDLPEEKKEEATRWYAQLARQMKQAKVEQKGHTYEVAEVMNELFFLHTTAMTSLNNKEYEAHFKAAQPLLQELMQKQQGSANEVLAGLTFLDDIWMLRVKKQTTSAETKTAIPIISRWMANLSHLYADMKAGRLDFTKN